jgi:hypothetical protein
MSRITRKNGLEFDRRLRPSPWSAFGSVLVYLIGGLIVFAIGMGLLWTEWQCMRVM